MNSFEYKILQYDLAKFWSGANIDASHAESTLNALGAQGWELVTSTTTTKTAGAGLAIIYTFKRLLT